MAAKSTFKISLEAEDKVTPVAKGAEKSVEKFFGTAKEAAKESGGLFGKLAATLGPVGTGLVGLGAAAVSILKIADYGAQAGREVEKLGAASGLTAGEVNKLVQASKEYESVAGRLTGALGLLAAPVTGFMATVGEGASAIILDFARGVQVLGTNAEESAKRMKQLLDSLKEVQKREGPATFRNVRYVEQGVVFSDAESVANEKQKVRDDAAAALRAEAARKYQDYLNELVAIGSVGWGDIAKQENARIEAENAALEARQDYYNKLVNMGAVAWGDIAAQENERIEAEERFAKEQINIGSQIEAILASQVENFAVAIASGKESLAKATQGLFSGLLTEVGQTLIQLGTAAVFSGLLASVFGTIASIPAGLAAIAAGTALVVGGAAIGGAFSGGGDSGAASATRSRGTYQGRDVTGNQRSPFATEQNQRLGSQSLTVVIQSAFPPSRAHAAELVDSLGPALEDASRRGRLRLG